MKKIVVSIMALAMCNGCYASQRDSINTSFKAQNNELDAQCKPADVITGGGHPKVSSMPEWCTMRYSNLEKIKAEELQEDRNKVNRSETKGWIIGGVITGLVVVGGLLIVGYCTSDPQRDQRGNCMPRRP